MVNPEIQGRLRQALALAKSRIEWILGDEDLLELASKRGLGDGTPDVLSEQAQELGDLVEELR